MVCFHRRLFSVDLAKYPLSLCCQRSARPEAESTQCNSSLALIKFAGVVVSITLNVCVHCSMREIGDPQVPAKGDDFKSGPGFSRGSL